MKSQLLDSLKTHMEAPTLTEDTSLNKLNFAQLMSRSLKLMESDLLLKSYLSTLCLEIPKEIIPIFKHRCYSKAHQPCAAAAKPDPEPQRQLREEGTGSLQNGQGLEFSEQNPFTHQPLAGTTQSCGGQLSLLGSHPFSLCLCSS